MKFVITVDTEADNQWKVGQPVTTENLEYLERFQKLCEKYDFKPTYLITYEIAKDERSVVLGEWQAAGLAEVGTHLHPWTNPPGDDPNGGHSFPSELTDDELKAKLESLTNLINENFGQPTSYRAGRWGFDTRQPKLLEELGYIVDCSVTPGVSWAKTKGRDEMGPDFRAYTARPHMLPDTNVLEVPMTIIDTGILGKMDGVFARAYNGMREGFLKKVFNKLYFNKRWLRIFPESDKYDWVPVLNAAKRDGLDVVEFMIHSSELMPGGSPYSKTEESVEKIYANLEAMFKQFSDRGVEGVTLSQYAREYSQNREV